MLSIVKMDLDCDSESADDEIHIDEQKNVKQEPVYIEDSNEISAESGLNLVPLVYTTRLDDMTILNSNISKLHPREVTAKILKESKPRLCIFPNNNYSLSNKRTFNVVKRKLKKIYDDKVSLGKNDIILDIPDPLINPDSIKSEVQTDAIVATEDEADSLIKCEVFDEAIIRECKYSELLRLCRPCSVVLPKLSVKYSSQTNKLVKPVISKDKIKKHIVKKKQHQNIQVRIASSSDEEPLNTYSSNLKSQLETHDPEVTYEDNKTGEVTLCKPCNCLALDESFQKVFVTACRIRNNSDGVLMLKIRECYSKEYSIYCTDHKGFLSEYYQEKDDNTSNNKYVPGNSSALYPVKTCCWVHRDRMIQSLYPKVLLYSSARFMRKPHTCPPSACSCCCRQTQGLYKKPDIFPYDAFSDVLPSISDEDIEIQALETEIQNSITKMQKELRVNSRSILHNLLKNPKSLIGKALMYKKPLPKKLIDNRRLESIKLDNSQAGVIVLKNFAADEREIYELSPDGELRSYLKLTCFKNTDRPDVKKLLQKANKVSDICCWFRREKLVTELVDSKTLHPSSIKFIRTPHMCTASECDCCCKPIDTKTVTLTGIRFPPRPSYWPEVLNIINKKPPNPSAWLDNYRIKPSSSNRTASISSPLPGPTKPIRIAPKLPKNMPPTIKFDSPGTVTPSLKNKRVRSVFAVGNSNTAMTNNDCQFVGVRSAPTFGLEPPLTNSVQTEQPNNLTKIQDAEVSEEVNSLITSILDRFKDVRLTINSDGKVSAALNTPVSGLTTVELKVLANILSYAQSQVNSLGLNSGMSLSNIIHMKVNDPQTANSVDPTSVYNAFGSNVNINNQSQAAQLNKPFNTGIVNAVPKPNIFPNLPSAPNKNDMTQFFTQSLHGKNQECKNSFTSLLSTKLDAEQSTSSIPVIQNVFSLKDQVSETENETSTTAVFCRTPANQNQIPKIHQNTKKRTPKDTKVTVPETKKIRVLSPSKLSITPADNLNAMMNSVYQPLPIPTLPTHALEVNGLGSGVPLLSNSQFKVVPVTPQVQQVTKPRIIRLSNFKAFSNPSTQPSMVVAPLSVPSGNVEQNLPMTGTPFSEKSVGTSDQTEDIEISEVPIKIEEDFNEEDDCILGV